LEEEEEEEEEVEDLGEEEEFEDDDEQFIERAQVSKPGPDSDSDVVEILSSDEEEISNQPVRVEHEDSDDDDENSRDPHRLVIQDGNDASDINEAEEDVGENFEMNVDGTFDLMAKKKAFHPVHEHLRWCPWATGEMPGWKLLLSRLEKLLNTEKLNGNQTSSASDTNIVHLNGEQTLAKVCSILYE